MGRFQYLLHLPFKHHYSKRCTLAHQGHNLPQFVCLLTCQCKTLPDRETSLVHRYASSTDRGLSQKSCPISHLARPHDRDAHPFLHVNRNIQRYQTQGTKYGMMQSSRKRARPCYLQGTLHESLDIRIDNLLCSCFGSSQTCNQRSSKGTHKAILMVCAHIRVFDSEVLRIHYQPQYHHL